MQGIELPDLLKQFAAMLPQQPKPYQPEDFLTADEVAKRLKCSAKTVQNAAKDGKLKHHYLPGSTDKRFIWSEVLEAMKPKQ